MLRRAAPVDSLRGSKHLTTVVSTTGIFSCLVYLVIGDGSASHSRSVAIHVVSRLCLVAIFHTVQGGSTCPSYVPAPPGAELQLMVCLLQWRGALGPMLDPPLAIASLPLTTHRYWSGAILHISSNASCLDNLPVTFSVQKCEQGCQFSFAHQPHWPQSRTEMEAAYT